MGSMSSKDDGVESSLVTSGWMYKKGNVVSNWKRRFFELYDNGRLVYFSDETIRTKKTTKGDADLSIIIGIVEVDNKNFEVVTPSRTWCFECKFKSERDEWVEAMKNMKLGVIHHDNDNLPKRDHLKLSVNASILKLISKVGSKNGEKILYSDQMIKINPKSKQQTRILLLTNTALYNIKPNDNSVYKKAQKRVEYKKIPCIDIEDDTKFKIVEFIYKTDTKNIKAIIQILQKFDIEIIFHRDEDEKEFNINDNEDSKEDMVEIPNDDNLEEEEEQFPNKSRNTIRGKSKIREELKDFEDDYDDDVVDDEQKDEEIVEEQEEDEDSKEDIAAEAEDEFEEEVIIPKKKKKKKKKKHRRVQSLARFATKKLQAKDFTFMSVIGRGTFGKIILVKKKSNNNIYAMKILKKHQIIENGQEKNVNAEREVLKSMQHPFLMQLRYAFQTESKLYLVLDYYRGGELMFHLKKKRRFSEVEAKFITCQITLALGHLHSNGFVYRDLKPENILLDDKGNCCLCDFGLCKNIEADSTDTFCGTPEYLAPEIVRKLPYDKNVDWWSLGILIFELTVGIVPFFASSNMAIYKKITDAPLMMASYIPNNGQDLIRALLQRDVTQRLGWKRDVEDIKKHEWFKDIDWTKVLNKEIEPPYVPEIEEEENEADLTNVAEKFQHEKACDTYVAQRPDLGDQAFFKGFTFRGEDADEIKDIFGGGSISMNAGQVNKLIHQRQESDGDDQSTKGVKVNKHTLNNLSMMDGDFLMGQLAEEAEDIEESEEGPLQEEEEVEEED